jgi:putative restriction endonuclease
LISISDDYRVLVSDAFVEDESRYSIRQFAGKEILLPGRREWWPEREKVEWHREWVGKTQVPSSKFHGSF